MHPDSTGPQKLEYDGERGGVVQLAAQIPTYQFAAAAVQEVQDVLQQVRSPKSTKLEFQKLPKRMRRRAMSHHPKRLPRKYRDIHIAQMAKSSNGHLSKIKTRKQRRLPSYLRARHLNLRRPHYWLETHIWHAKRFHMVKRWGYSLAYKSCDKTYRACYRASAHHCLLQDISYYGCLELSGPLANLVDGFRRLTSNECGKSIADKISLQGKTEGQLMLYKADEYPKGALGPVSYLWRPLPEAEQKTEGENLRTVWLWVHPLSYALVKAELVKVFQLKATKLDKVPVDNVKKANTINMNENSKKHQNIDDEDRKSKKPQKFMIKYTAIQRTPIFIGGGDSCRIELIELKNQFNRFRLTGSLSQAVLSHALKPVDEAQLSNFLDKLPSKDKDDNWFAIHEMQLKYWEHSQLQNSPAEFPSNIILGLNVQDPRIHRPTKRTKATNENNTDVQYSYLATKAHESQVKLYTLLMQTTQMAQSLLWNKDNRDYISKNMISTKDYCYMRARHVIVAGAGSAFEGMLQPLPLLLIQRPGCTHIGDNRIGYGCGWDIIAPAGYGMSLWLSLVMWGARPGGLREVEMVTAEMGGALYAPDTPLGHENTTMRCAQLQSKYARTPPNKRCNYHVLGIVSPFRPPFKELLRDWIGCPPALNPSESVTNDQYSVYVVRNREILSMLRKSLTNPSLIRCLLAPGVAGPQGLIPIQIRMLSRGSINDFSLICVPSKVDYNRWIDRKHQQRNCHAGISPVYQEPLLSDAYRSVRKGLRVRHQKLLKRLRRQRRMVKKKSDAKVGKRCATTEHLVNQHVREISRLWLPGDLSTLYSVRRQCSREVCGYITNTLFSFSRGGVCILGYVTYEGLQQLFSFNQQLKNQSTFCLVRNTKSRNYHFGQLNIACDEW